MLKGPGVALGVRVVCELVTWCPILTINLAVLAYCIRALIDLMSSIRCYNIT